MQEISASSYQSQLICQANFGIESINYLKVKIENNILLNISLHFMKLYITILLVILFVPLNCLCQSEKKAFVIEITFIDWMDQPFVKYTLNNKYITVETSGYEDFKIIKSVLYKRKISQFVGDSIYKTLSRLKIDTSKANCNNPVLDGLYKCYYFEGYGLGSTLIKTYSCITSSAAKLQLLVENQIKRKKFKYNNLKSSY